VALGTDGPMLDNSVDMVEVLKFTSALHNVHHLNPRALPAERVLEMATINAARALGMEEEIGSLEPGKKADITIFDMDRPEWIPMHNPIQTLVYSAGGESVETVLIDGRVVMENRKVQTVDEKEILHQVKTLAPAVAQRAGLEPQTSWTLV
ncbi:MAG: amidohydrolase family protein, partial [Nitrospinota bacterium]|nr:amidohydrolase family protein [Nitrospinota bacterium]